MELLDAVKQTFKNAILVTIMAVPTMISTSLAQAETVLLDQVVAIVEDDIVLASELRERLARVEAGIASRGVQDAPPQEELVRDTLDLLILESIQLQRARRAGVRISDAQLNGIGRAHV